MYIANGIAYAKEPMAEIIVTDVKALENHVMILKFSNHEERIYDASELLMMPAFEKLKEDNIFLNPVIDNGIVTWDNGNIDIAPETLYYNSYEYITQNKCN